MVTKMRKLVYIGVEFNINSKGYMSSLYECISEDEIYERFDYGLKEQALEMGASFIIRQATKSELDSIYIKQPKWVQFMVRPFVNAYTERTCKE